MSGSLKLTKYFPFSISFKQGRKVLGRNYRLGVITNVLDEAEEKIFEDKVHDSLIRHLDSRDLNLHVEFLKNVAITDENLLKIFWNILEKALSPATLHALSLDRDDRTQTTLLR